LLVSYKGMSKAGHRLTVTVTVKRVGANFQLVQ